jgi:hypothetical protein
MKEQKKIVLMKNLPNCPKGRIFKQDINGDFFHSMTDDEAIEGKLKSYKFTKEEIANNRKWFSNVC